MKYSKIITLKNGMECCLRNATESDGQLVLDNFNLTHTQTDYLLTYPDENTFDAAQESRILKEKENNPKIEYAATDNGFFPTFIFPGLGNQICNHSCRNTNRCAKKAHTKDKQQDCNNNRCYCKHPKLLDPRIVEHHRNTSDNRDENRIAGNDKRGQKSEIHDNHLHNPQDRGKDTNGYEISCL